MGEHPLTGLTLVKLAENPGQRKMVDDNSSRYSLDSVASKKWAVCRLSRMRLMNRACDDEPRMRKSWVKVHLLELEGGVGSMNGIRSW